MKRETSGEANWRSEINHVNLGYGFPRITDSFVKYDEPLVGYDQYEELIKRCDEITFMYGHDIKIDLGRGLILMRMSEFEESIEWSDRVLAVAPEHRTANMNKGYALLILGRAKQALECFRVLEKRGFDPEVFYWTGVSLICVERYEESIECFDCIKERGYPSYDVYNAMGYAYAKMGQFSKSRRFFEEAMRMDQNRTDALYNMADMAEGRGRRSQPMRYYRRILRRRPNDQKALKGYSRMCAELRMI